MSLLFEIKYRGEVVWYGSAHQYVDAVDAKRAALLDVQAAARNDLPYCDRAEWSRKIERGTCALVHVGSYIEC